MRGRDLAPHLDAFFSFSFSSRFCPEESVGLFVPSCVGFSFASRSGSKVSEGSVKGFGRHKYTGAVPFHGAEGGRAGGRAVAALWVRGADGTGVITY